MRWAFARGDLPPPSPSLEARVLPASGRQIDAVTNGWIRGRRCNKLPISTCSGGTSMKSTAFPFAFHSQIDHHIEFKPDVRRAAREDRGPPDLVRVPSVSAVRPCRGCRLV